MENNYVDTYICDLHFVKFCKKYTIYLGMWKIKKIMVQKGKKNLILISIGLFVQITSEHIYGQKFSCNPM
jgi:hypothetical protein